MQPVLLIIDDEEAICSSLRFALEDEYDVRTASDQPGAINVMESDDVGLVLLDLKLGKANGYDVLVEVKSHFPDTAVIVMTAYGSIRSSVECMRAGAYYYVTKPLDMEEVRHLLRQAREFAAMKRRIKYLEGELSDRYASGIVGSSKAMQKVFGLITKVRDIDANVLITGESGTGKELVARALHFGGRRARSRFEVVNCAAIPAALLESELFGHEKGAFTGAYARKPGSFEMADGGTVFLDEIGEMDMGLQSKLLRVIQNREFAPLGSTQPRRVDVRIIAATNKELSREVETGRFRQDLFYRLNVINIRVPALRERAEDIPLLVAHFIKRYGDRFSKAITGIDGGALKILERYGFPGNVRELENIIERAVALADGQTITAPDLPEWLSGDAEVRDSVRATTRHERLADIERAAIIESLKRHGGNRRATARSLGISERNLRNKIAQYRREGSFEEAG
ncbi:MAG: sigma-54-dependent Fis family transcriptional regulator [Firmicutes bacterium]|nr:sigma-54-dependent Fis family transcriptional regulator [Bacillota bacterium]